MLPAPTHKVLPQESLRVEWAPIYLATHAAHRHDMRQLQLSCTCFSFRVRGPCWTALPRLTTASAEVLKAECILLLALRYLGPVLNPLGPSVFVQLISVGASPSRERLLAALRPRAVVVLAFFSTHSANPLTLSGANGQALAALRISDWWCGFSG